MVEFDFSASNRNWSFSRLIPKEFANKFKVVIVLLFVSNCDRGSDKVPSDFNPIWLQLKFKEVIELRVVNNEKASNYFDSIIMKLGNIADLKYVTDKVDGALSYRVKSNEYFIPITGNIDVEAEIAKLTEELNYTKGFLRSVQGKLSNEKFVAGAPEQVIANERKKEADALAKIAMIEQSLAGLK